MNKAVISRSNLNKGNFLGANIYSDIRGNKCDCGGKFTKYEDIKGYKLPICNSCKSNPPRYRIHAKIENEDDVKSVVTIRYSQDGDRLEDPIDVLTCLRRIRQELKEETFDFRRYDSKANKESFLFKNFIKKYLSHNERKLKRNEISFNGLRDKKSLIKNHLLPYFKDIDINKITSARLNHFRDSFVSKLRTRDKALSELKTILNYANKVEMLDKMPHFERIERSKKRKKIPDIQTVKRVINHVDDYYKDCFKLLAIYPIRPCEIRCLRWKDVNLFNNTITIQRHMSGRIEQDGRKSLNLEHEKGKMVYPLIDEAKEIFLNLTRVLDQELLIFPSKISQTKIMSHSALPEAWNRACDKAGVERFHSYEIKHARITEISEMSNGNMMEVMEATGHTNLNTVMRYAKNNTDLSKIFQ